MRYKISSFGGMAKPGNNLMHYLPIFTLFLCCMGLFVFFNGLFSFFVIIGIFFGLRIVIRKLTGHATSGLGLLKNISLILIFMLTGFTFSVLRTETNYYYLMDRNANLKVKDKGLWVLIQNATQLDAEEVYSNPKLS